VDYLLNIKNIPELDFADTNKGLKIGAVTPLSHIIKEEKVKTNYTALYEGIMSMAAPAIRNMGTVAGNIGNASPAADTVPPLMVYGAEVKLQSKRGERTVLLEDFITGVGKTLLEPDELITEINIPEIPKNTGSTFLKKSRVKADLSKINLAVYLEREGDTCQDCKIVFGSVAITALRAEKTEKLIKGQIINSELINKAAEQVASEIKPIDDIRSTFTYRLQMSKTILKEGLTLA
jgi:carbon-monoxide dehydrogenase medium subunit